MAIHHTTCDCSAITSIPSHTSSGIESAESIVAVLEWAQSVYIGALVYELGLSIINKQRQRVVSPEYACEQRLGLMPEELLVNWDSLPLSFKH